jgi:hypothetical protein
MKDEKGDVEMEMIRETTRNTTKRHTKKELLAFSAAKP